MDPQYMILIYSKYSPKCCQIMELLSKQSIDYIKPLCVDNVNVRNTILKNSTYKIYTVPTILLVYPNDTVEKFEGPNVASWVLDQLTPTQPPSQTPAHEPEFENAQTVEKPQQQVPPPKAGFQHTNIGSLVDESDDDAEVQVVEMDLERPTQPLKTESSKDILAIAQEMAKSRENADAPIHQRKREIAQQEFETSQNV